jgi:hypothetical protein
MKSRFSSHDDSLLADAVARYGTTDWSVIAKEIPNRNARQCRERWNNYVNPMLNDGPWTEEEDQLLIQKVNDLPGQMIAITAFFPGRSRNNVRNRVATITHRNVQKEQTSTMNGMKILPHVERNFNSTHQDAKPV